MEVGGGVSKWLVGTQLLATVQNKEICVHTESFLLELVKKIKLFASSLTDLIILIMSISWQLLNNIISRYAGL